jgi:hypothetical protein
MFHFDMLEGERVFCGRGVTRREPVRIGDWRIGRALTEPEMLRSLAGITDLNRSKFAILILFPDAD